MTNRKLLRCLVAALALALSGVVCLFAGAAPRSHPPRNIIVMIGDGRGFNHVTAADLYATGMPGTAVYEGFPVQLAMATYSLTAQKYDPARAWETFDWVKTGPTDSAAAATALATGRKTYNGAIGVVPVDPADPATAEPVENMLERAEARGKSSGVVTSVQLSHATPAGFVAHNKARGDYAAISRQMLEDSRCDVIMGCGHPLYDDAGQPRADDLSDDGPYQFVGGREEWARVCAGKAGGDADGDGIADPWKLVERRRAFQRLATGPAPKRVLGVVRCAGTLQQSRPGDAAADAFAVPLNERVPTLAEMSRAALNVLGQDPDGFVLMIEGGAIDWAAHGNQLGREIEEAMGFADAAQAVVAWVEAHGGWSENLVIVTSDHETGYLTGPGSGPREGEAPLWAPLVSNGIGRMPGAEWHATGHTNSLVPLAAKGAGSELLVARAAGTDPVRGPYADNTDVAGVVFELLR
jgi:alkaline phosphatase